MDWLDLLAVQGTLKSLPPHHSSKASFLWCSAFFIAQLSHPYITTGKTIALTRWTFVGKIMSLFFNMLSRLVIIFVWSHHFMANIWGNNGNSDKLFFWTSKSLQTVTASMKLRVGMGKEMGGRFKREVIYVYLWLILVEV